MLHIPELPHLPQPVIVNLPGTLSPSPPIKSSPKGLQRRHCLGGMAEQEQKRVEAHRSRVIIKEKKHSNFCGQEATYVASPNTTGKRANTSSRDFPSNTSKKAKGRFSFFYTQKVKLSSKKLAKIHKWTSHFQVASPAWWKVLPLIQKDKNVTLN